MNRITRVNEIPDWLNDFANSPLVQTAALKVQADYLSHLKNHAEEMKNKGRYINIQSALEDFSTRLNLTSFQRTALAAAVVKHADFFDDEKLEDDLKNGAPKSILPGVAPTKENNKVKVNKEEAESMGAPIEQHPFAGTSPAGTTAQ